ncbi:hypothetical protein WDU94_014815 [Cyamophila willieti]
MARKKEKPQEASKIYSLRSFRIENPRKFLQEGMEETVKRRVRFFETIVEDNPSKNTFCCKQNDGPNVVEVVKVSNDCKDRRDQIPGVMNPSNEFETIEDQDAINPSIDVGIKKDHILEVINSSNDCKTSQNNFCREIKPPNDGEDKRDYIPEVIHSLKDFEVKRSQIPELINLSNDCKTSQDSVCKDIKPSNDCTETKPSNSCKSKAGLKIKMNTLSSIEESYMYDEEFSRVPYDDTTDNNSSDGSCVTDDESFWFDEYDRVNAYPKLTDDTDLSDRHDSEIYNSAQSMENISDASALFFSAHSGENMSDLTPTTPLSEVDHMSDFNDHMSIASEDPSTSTTSSQTSDVLSYSLISQDHTFASDDQYSDEEVDLLNSTDECEHNKNHIPDDSGYQDMPEAGGNHISEPIKGHISKQSEYLIPDDTGYHDNMAEQSGVINYKPRENHIFESRQGHVSEPGENNIPAVSGYHISNPHLPDDKANQTSAHSGDCISIVDEFSEEIWKYMTAETDNNVLNTNKDHFSELIEDHSDPNEESISDSNEKLISELIEDHISDPNEEFISDPNENHISNRIEERISNPNEGHASDSNQERMSDSNEDVISDLNEDHNSDPNENYISDSNEDHASNPHEESISDPNEDRISELRHSLGSEDTSDPNECNTSDGIDHTPESEVIDATLDGYLTTLDHLEKISFYEKGDAINYSMESRVTEDLNSDGEFGLVSLDIELNYSDQEDDVREDSISDEHIPDNSYNVNGDHASDAMVYVVNFTNESSSISDHINEKISEDIIVDDHTSEIDENNFSYEAIDLNIACNSSGAEDTMINPSKLSDLSVDQSADKNIPDLICDISRDHISSEIVEVVNHSIGSETSGNQILNEDVSKVTEYDEYFIKENVKKILGSFEAETNVPLSAWYKLFTWQFPYYRNFLKNSKGEDYLNDWKISHVKNGQWQVVCGSEILPPDCIQMGSYWKSGDGGISSVESFFSVETCFEYCSKEQLVNLNKMSLLPAMMIDKYQPKIVYQDWYHRGNLVNSYKLTVSLLDENEQELCSRIHFRETETTPGPVDWKKIVNFFEKYPPGVRYIRFRHGSFIRGGHPLRVTHSCVYLIPSNHEIPEITTDELESAPPT